MAACCRNFECSFDIFLAFNVFEIYIEIVLAEIELFLYIYFCFREFFIGVEEISYITEFFGTVNIKSFYNCCFVCILCRYEYAFVA